MENKKIETLHVVTPILTEIAAILTCVKYDSTTVMNLFAGTLMQVYVKGHEAGVIFERKKIEEEQMIATQKRRRLKLIAAAKEQARLARLIKLRTSRLKKKNNKKRKTGKNPCTLTKSMKL